MKRILTIALSVLPLIAAAQSFTNLTLQQAQEKAQNEKKIILVDVMNMRQQNDAKLKQEKDVLALEGVSDYIAQNIVAIRIDMGTEAGKEFAPLLQMNMYPAYAFLMPNGDLLQVVHPFLIGKTPSLFLEKAKEAVSIANEKWKNSRQITFKEISFEQALEIATKENRLIFIDAYTDNCQPCMKMAKNVFTLDRVADFYNANFINLSLNLGTVRTDLAKKYNTFGYPSYLFINAKGDLIYSADGYTEADKFIEYGKTALSKQSIQFTDGTWNEILQMAKKENKPIFVDCYTVWCGPCKMMAKDVFTDSKVAEYYNANFINYKSDMEKGEGIELKNKFGINAYPTFLYIDKNGNVINRIVGSMPANEFIEKSKSGMSEKGVAAMQERYTKGERSESFLKEYLKVLEEAYLQKDARKVTEELFKTTDLSLLKSEEYFNLYEKYIDSPDSEIFKYIYSNKNEFYKLYPKERIDKKFTMVWGNGSRTFVKKIDGAVQFDSKGYEQYLKRMKKEKVKDLEEITFNADLFNADQMGKWKEYVELADARIKKIKIENVPDIMLYNWGLRIDQNCKDKQLREKAAGWFSSMLPVIADREAKAKERAVQSGGMVAFSMVNYLKEYQRLCTSLTGKQINY